MRKRVIALGLVVSIVALLLSSGGCAKLRQKVESMKPEIRGTTLEWGEVSSETTEIIATMIVYNPNPFSLPLKKVRSDITMNDIKVGSAETLDLHIEKNAEFPIEILAEIDNSKIPEVWVEHLRRHEASDVLIDIYATFDLMIRDFTFPFHLRRAINTDILSELQKVDPVEVAPIKIPTPSGEIIPFKITVKSLSGSWREVTIESTRLNLSALIHNDNNYPLVVPKISYDITMNEYALASGETEANYILASNSDGSIDFMVVFDNSLLDDCFVSHIKNGERSTFNVSVSLVFELPEEVIAGGMELKVLLWEGSQPLETDILGSKR